MFDDTTAALIPSTAKVIGVYIDGRYKNDAEIRTKFPQAALVTIAVSANDNAEVLDVEAMDATIAEVYAWLKRQLARGVYLPVIYISVSQVDRLMETMTANGFVHGKHFRIWSAHYGAGEHLCGPSTCKLTKTACDWTQFTNRANNSSLDESDLGTVAPSFTAPKPAPVPVKAAAPVTPTVTVPTADEAKIEADESTIETDLNAIKTWIAAHH